jgi:hypothetical protein
MRDSNRLQVAPELSLCGPRIDMTPHARQRTLERSSLAPSRVRQLVTTSHALSPPFRAGNRSHYIFFDNVKMNFMVAVVAIDSGRKGSSASIVTVLTREQFEHDAGPIAARSPRTAASRALSPVEFRHWENIEFGPKSVRRRYHVFTYHRNQDGSTGCNIFRNAPICDQFIDDHDLVNAASHPGFLNWYGRLAYQISLPIDSVVSLRIADTDKIRLDIKAPAKECPYCQTKKSR